MSATAPFDTAGLDVGSKGDSRLATRLCDASHFLRNLRMQLRFGDISRAPLRLLRFHMLENLVECDWVARAPDEWDADLPRSAGRRHASLQALRDAIEIRNLLFKIIPEVDTAVLRVYRSNQECASDELIISGTSERSDRPACSIRSIAMRAHLFGFRFSIENGILNRLP